MSNRKLIGTVTTRRIIIAACLVPIFNNVTLVQQREDIIPAGKVEEDQNLKVYAPSNSTSNVAICAIVKNESLYIDEWVDYNIALGFSPIIIYDNSISFDLMTAPHVNSSYSWYQLRNDTENIKLIHFPENPVQIAAYERCIKRDASNSTFVALFDVDEFLVLKKHKNVVDLMDEYCNEECGELSFNWRMMGISGEKNYTPVPVTKRNVHYDDFGTIKVILRPAYVADEFSWWHSVMLKRGNWLDTNGKKHHYGLNDWHRQSNSDNPMDVALLHHYSMKSEGEYHYKKCVRGHSRAIGKNPIPQCTNPGYYKLKNGTKFDDTAWKHLTRMVPKYRVFGNAISNT